MSALCLSICAPHLIQQQRGCFPLNRGCGEIFKCTQPADATQRGFRFPSGICKNESCRHTLHKPELPLVESSIIIKLHTSTQQRSFSSSLIFILHSFSCFSRLSLTSRVKSSSNFSPAQASISPCSQPSLFLCPRMHLRGSVINDKGKLLLWGACYKPVTSSALPIFTLRSCCFPETVIVSFTTLCTWLRWSQGWNAHSCHWQRSNKGLHRPCCPRTVR